MDSLVIPKCRKSSQVKKICRVCGTEFWVKPSQAEKRKTCSRKCMGLFQTKEKIILNCSFCGKEIEKYPSQLKQYTQYKSKNFFCNRKCQTKFHAGDGNPNRRKANDVKLKCEHCGDFFYRPKWQSFNPGTKKPTRFCSRHCYEEYCSKKSGIACSEIEVVCSWCGKDKKVSKTNYQSNKTFFCNLTCQGEYQSVFNTGKDSHNYKGGFSIDDRPSYDTNNDKISFKVETRRSVEGIYLEVRCSYCNKWFEPSRNYLNRVLNGYTNQNGDLGLYCSDGCKKACPVFGQQKYPMDFKRASSREVSPDLRQMCLERDEWQCQRCGEIKSPLHCHHIDGAVQNKMISNDLENVITFCKKCHKEAHSQDGCRYHELKCN